MTDVRRVWGKADNLSLEFTYIGQEQWETIVPADTKDGVYAVELWAVNGVGDIGHWTGELFMCSGVCCIKIFQQSYQIWFKKLGYGVELSKNYEIYMEKEEMEASTYKIVMDKELTVFLEKEDNVSNYEVTISKELLILFERGCSHVR